MVTMPSPAVPSEAIRPQPNGSKVETSTQGQLGEPLFRAATLSPTDPAAIDEARVTILLPLGSKPEPFVIVQQMEGDRQ